MPEEHSPFSDLPAALVEEVLEQTSAVGDLLLKTFRDLKNERTAYRKVLTERNLIVHESTLGYPPLPTTCAADGSYAIERLLTVDLAAAASVAVEGLTPPSEKRHWDRPHHSTYVVAEVHHADTATVLRAVMLGRELLLAAQAPHDLVMLDMTLTLPIIYFNQALNQAPNSPMLQCSQEFLRNCGEYLEAYSSILRSERSDKNYVGLPKYSTRREIGKLIGLPTAHDDRGFLTLVLNPGELTLPVTMEQPAQEWHLNSSHVPSSIKDRVNNLAQQVVAGLKKIQILYYKPHEWLPALRIEVPHNVGANKHRLSAIIQGLKHQCATASMLEPYPLYLADRTVKALAKALPSFRQVTTQRISEEYEGDIGEVFFAMHGYRSESGG